MNHVFVLMMHNDMEHGDFDGQGRIWGIYLTRSGAQTSIRRVVESIKASGWNVINQTDEDARAIRHMNNTFGIEVVRYWIVGCSVTNE